MCSISCCGIPELLVSFFLRLKLVVPSGLMLNFKVQLWVGGRFVLAAWLPSENGKCRRLSSCGLIGVCIFAWLYYSILGTGVNSLERGCDIEEQRLKSACAAMDFPYIFVEARKYYWPTKNRFLFCYRSIINSLSPHLEPGFRFGICGYHPCQKSGEKLLRCNNFFCGNAEVSSITCIQRSI